MIVLTSTPTRIATFVAGLALVFVAAFGIGSAVGPVGDTPAEHDEEVRHDGHER